MTEIQRDLFGLASHLVHDGLLEYQLAIKAQDEAKNFNIPFISYLVKNNILNSQAILQSCAKTFGLPIFDLNDYENEWLNHVNLNADLIRRYHLIPLKKQNNVLQIGISDPTDRQGLDTVTFYTGLNVSPVLIAEEQLENFINTHFENFFGNQNLELSLLKELLQEDNHHVIKEHVVIYDEPLIRFVDHTIKHAIQQHASDIHIEPFETICRIRYRQDGILYEIAEIPIKLASRLVTRLKVMAKLDIAERRLPQDGRFQFQNIDIRVNTCPTLFGEKLVLRLLDANKVTLNIHELGFTESQKQIFLNNISQPQGLIFVTGPTGSGKTVTLYSALNYLNTIEKNISTVEDPVEIQLNGINQVNIHPKINLQFATALRTFLRQDPDVIMVGEVRDTETAEIAIQAAQTGHLVITTLHTNSAVETIARLQSMGIASYNIISSISLIIAQRLIRKLCVHCKQPESISPPTLQKMGFKIASTHLPIFRAIGCQHCLQGYQGRIGIFELLPISENIAQLILTNANTLAITTQAKSEGFISLRNAGFDKVLAGITSLAEINRVTNSP